MPTDKRLHLRPATAEDVPALAALHTSVADHLTQLHGQGPWSSHTSEKGALYALRHSDIFVARQSGRIVATFRLARKKPWAIDLRHFRKCERPVYLTSMAVTPFRQRLGIGRWCLDEAARIALALPADAIRLDAYDAPAGAGGFYARCGYAEVGRGTYRKVPLIYYELRL